MRFKNDYFHGEYGKAGATADPPGRRGPRYLSVAVLALIGALSQTGQIGAQPVPPGVTVDPVYNDVTPGGASTPEWNPGVDVTVGNTGEGRLTIGAGGRVATPRYFIGYEAGSRGGIIVEGGGSLEAPGQVWIGGHGEGHLEIRDGSTVTNGFGVISAYEDGTGSAIVMGPDARWINEELYVGYLGVGTLTISNGAQVSSTSGGIAAFAGSTASVTVDGPGSRWANSVSVHVGWGDVGSLSITNGGEVTAPIGEIGTDPGTHGTATVSGSSVTGAVSTLRTDGNLAIGIGGTGHLSVLDGGLVSNATAVLGQDAGSQGTVVVGGDDGRGHQSTWSSSGLVTIGQDGVGTLTVQPGGVVLPQGGIHMAANAGSNGTINLMGDASARAVLETGPISGGAGTSVLHFDGGILRPSGSASNHLPGVTSLTFGAAGGRIDTNGHDIGIASPLSGAGNFIKQGAGSLTLTGDSAGLTGPTTVEAGRLVVNGAIANSAVSVHDGATLAGNGTVGASTILGGGAVAPGNSLGTLTVNGNYTQAAGSIYAVEVDPNSSASDLIVVNGAATIQDGAMLNVSKVTPGDYRLDARYTVLTASGGITGDYDVGGDISVTPYLSLQQLKSGNNLDLLVIQTGDPGSSALTPNQTAAAGGVGSLPGGGAISTALLNTPDTDTTRAAFDALSGELHASARTALLTGSHLLREATVARLGEIFCPQTVEHRRDTASPEFAVCSAERAQSHAWGKAFGSWGHVSGNGNAAALKEKTAGLLLGIDRPLRDWRLGLFGGVSRTDFDVRARTSSGDVDSHHLGVYAGTQRGDLGLRLGASHSWHRGSTGRSVLIGGFSDQLRARYKANTTQVYGEVGRTFPRPRGAVEPFAQLAWARVDTDRFDEHGGDAALRVDADKTSLTFATLGVRGASRREWGGRDVTLRGMIGWRHAFGHVTPAISASFANGAPFTIEGAPLARDAAVVKAGFAVPLKRNVTATLDYAGQYGQRVSEHGLRATVTYRF